MANYVHISTVTQIHSYVYIIHSKINIFVYNNINPSADSAHLYDDRIPNISVCFCNLPDLAEEHFLERILFISDSVLQIQKGKYKIYSSMI